MTGEGLPAYGDQSQVGERLRVEQRHQGRREFGHGHPLLAHEGGELFRGVFGTVADNHQAGSGEQGGEQFEDRHVEAVGRKLQQPVGLRDFVVRRDGCDEVVGRAVLYHDALGGAGGSRGEQHVGRVGGE